MSNRELLLSLARTFSGFDGTCLLYSGPGYAASQKSILALFPIKTITLPNGCWEELKHHMTPLEGKWFGAITYEACSYFQKYAVVITLDHLTDQFDLFFGQEETTYHIPEELRDPLLWHKLIKAPVKAIQSPIKVVKQLDNASDYIEKVEKAIEYIKAGDIYQVNLSQKMILAGKWDPFEIFYQLIHLNPSPFSAYLRLKDKTYVSTSPERLLCKQHKLLRTSPIKGTAPRGKTLAEDAENKARLMASPKELSELLMITDLMRNDLSTVSKPGSVKVDNLWECQTYTNVHHLVSNIQSQAKEELHPVEILKSCFPGGSVTGCPKIRAMEIIEELEGTPRGIYTGSIGYFDGEDFDFNIAIRTLEFTGNLVNIQLGGGIVADSEPYLEYEETLHKGQTLFKAFGLN